MTMNENIVGNHSAAFWREGGVGISMCIPNQITDWKSRLLEGAAGVFGAEGLGRRRRSTKALHAKIGELTLENDFEGALSKAGMLKRKAMIDRPTHALPVTRQAEVLKLSRSSVYYRPGRCRRRSWRSCAGSTSCIWITVAGSRMLRDLLVGEGCRDRAPARRHADEADGDRGALPAAEHLESHARQQDLPYLLRGP